MTTDWVITFTFDADLPMETLDKWETDLAGFDAFVARVPGRGVAVTVYAPGDLGLFDALNKMQGEVLHVVDVGQPTAVEIVTEIEHQRRAEAYTMPELMSAAEIADELGISRQRVHQLRSTAGFPEPLADLRGGAVWDAAAVRKFAQTWERKPGRPPSGTASGKVSFRATEARGVRLGDVSGALRTQRRTALCCATSATTLPRTLRSTSRESTLSPEICLTAHPCNPVRDST